MTWSRAHTDAVRVIVELPVDDWQPEHHDLFDVARSALADQLAHEDRQRARRDEAEERRKAGRPPRSVPRRRESAVLRDARPVVAARSGGCCEASTPACPPGEHRAEHVHHIRGRRHETPADLLHVCHLAHSYIHAHPVESYAAGWMGKRLGVES